MTSLLRQKLDALGSGYELTHAPMDTDLVSSSEYYKILQEQNANLNFLMPQFYNGVTRPVTDGVTASSAGRVSAVSMFDDLATDLFPGQPHKVSATMYDMDFECYIVDPTFMFSEVSLLSAYLNATKNIGGIRLLYF